ncbi:putative two-component sensor histidine kinase [Paenibacillus sp. 598K]|nr:putative two-component sensor histidine kinase [Paenibacillus sp. 598K]
MLESIVSHFASPVLSIRISDQNNQVMVQQGDFDFGQIVWQQLAEDTLAYETWRDASRHYIQAASWMETTSGRIYVETIRDVTSVFMDRQHVFSFYRKLVLVMLVINGIVMFLITAWALSPLKKLAKTTREIAEGKYGERVLMRTKDEVGLLATDFNQMADRLETKIRELEAITASQRDFIGSFAHELKTPLTSIIGYADMLRSKKLSEENKILAADYIFSEGKRLETLSHKLLDLLVVKNHHFDMKLVQIKELLFRVKQTTAWILKQSGVVLHIAADDAQLNVESDLLQTLLINLVDNARKAIDSDRVDREVKLTGKRVDSEHYLITVEDHGKGIPEKEISRITEVFYTVDKSRFRGSGVGIGLALCKEIVELHGGEMKISSRPGAGTRVEVKLKGGAGDEGSR